MDTLVTNVSASRFIGKMEEETVKKLNSHLRYGTVSMEDIVAQDRNIRRLHNMRPIGHIFCSDKRGRLLWKYRDDVFVSYSSRHHTDSKYGTLNMLKGEQLDELQSELHNDGRPELLSLANDLSVPAGIRALAVHDYGSYNGWLLLSLLIHGMGEEGKSAKRR